MKSVNEHVFFFDIRNTLGVVDRPGHLIAFRPSVIELLETLGGIDGVRLAVITNVPPGVDAQNMLKGAGLDGFFEKIISTPDPEILAVQAAKPQRRMYELAAKAMGVEPGLCTYISENLVEVLGAINAGMHGVVKKFPPGGDYMRAKLELGVVTDTSSGRLAEAVLEGQHVVGKRIVLAGANVVERLRAGENPHENDSPLLSAMSRIVWLLNNFVDPYHHRMEEEVMLPFAHMRGVPASSTAWLVEDHDQGRAYFRALTIALRRIQSGNTGTVQEFAAILDAFVRLYKAHGEREDNETFKYIGDRLTGDDDALMCGVIERLGAPDITLYYDMIQAMETDLGLQPQ